MNLDDAGRCSSVFLRQLEFEATFSATLREVPRTGNRAGISVYASPDHHFDCFVERGAHGPVVKLRRLVSDLEHIDFVSIPDGLVTLEVVCDGSEYRFEAIVAGERLTVGRGSAHLLNVANIPGFRSVRFGVFSNDCWELPQLFEAVSGTNVG